MKKILYVAAAAMFLIAGCKGNGATQPAENAPAQAVGSSDIAFVQVEAVLAQSDLFQSEGAALQEKTKKAQEGWAKKERDLQSKAAQLQEKYQKGLITTANAQSEQEKIQRQIANYQSVAQKEAQTLDEENYVFTNRAQDLIHRAVQELNADKKYKLILNATSLVDADSLLDITPLVVRGDNAIGVTVAKGWWLSKLPWSREFNYGDKYGLLAQIVLRYKDGTKEVIATDDTWRASTGEVSYGNLYDGETIDLNRRQKGWDTPSFDDASWASVQVADTSMSECMILRVSWYIFISSLV